MKLVKRTILVGIASILTISSVFLIHAFTLGITVSTDKPSYTLGETMIVSGTATSDAIVTILVTNPADKIVAIDQVITDKAGFYSTSFKIPSEIPTGGWTEFGTYTVKATDGATGESAIATFTLVPPRLKLPIMMIGNITFVDPFSGESIVPTVGRMCLVRSKIKNTGGAEQPLLYIVQVKDEAGVVIAIVTAEATLPLGASIGLGAGWTPTKVGVYAVEVFVWRSFAEPIALMEKSSVTITVTE